MNELQITEYKNIRVLTTQQIAEAYGTDGKVISNNFNRNRDRYEEWKHFICLEGESLKEFKTNHQFDESSKVNRLYLWTEKGAFLHAKSLNTDIAWEVYDRLVDNYFQKQQKLLSPQEMMRIQLGMIDNHEERIFNLENNMTIDYGQQRVLEDAVNVTVIEILGGKGSEAYHEIGRKVFTECNRDLKKYFNVNARNNVPKKRFEEAVEYAKNWKPCTNTLMMIKECNAQISI